MRERERMSSTSGSAWDHSNNGGGGSPELREALLLGDGGSSPESREIKGIAVKKQDDLEEIRSVGELMRLAAEENRRLWYLAGPAIFTSLAQYSLGAVTQVFAGHLTTLELDAVSTENMVIAGLAFGIMVSQYSLRFMI